MDQLRAAAEKNIINTNMAKVKKNKKTMRMNIKITVLSSAFASVEKLFLGLTDFFKPF